jgi:hypothetical protein
MTEHNHETTIRRRFVTLVQSNAHVCVGIKSPAKAPPLINSKNFDGLDELMQATMKSPSLCLDKLIRQAPMQKINMRAAVCRKGDGILGAQPEHTFAQANADNRIDRRAIRSTLSLSER